MFGLPADEAHEISRQPATRPRRPPPPRRRRLTAGTQVSTVPTTRRANRSSRPTMCLRAYLTLAGGVWRPASSCTNERDGDASGRAADGDARTIRTFPKPRTAKVDGLGTSPIRKQLGADLAKRRAGVVLPVDGETGTRQDHPCTFA